MSLAASDNVFMSALQPNNSVTTYALPTEIQIGNGGSTSDEVAKARRVQQQVKMRLAEKSTLPRQNGSAANYAMSDYGGGSSTAHYNTYTPNYSSRSAFAMSGSRTLGPSVSIHKSGFTSRSTGPELSQFQKMSIGGGGAGGGEYYQEDLRMGGYQGGTRQNRMMEAETMSMHSMRQPLQVNSWVVDNSDAGSLMSERDATYGRQYAQSAINGYSGQMRQGGGTMTYPAPMRRSLSGTLSRGGGMTAGGQEIVQQHSFKGPAHRTISRITNRNRMSMGGVPMGLQQQLSSGGSTYRGGADMVDSGFMYGTLQSGSQGNLLMQQQRQGTLSRAMSVKSMQSVGKGVDVYYQENGMGNLSGMDSLDMETAVAYLCEPDAALQVMGAAFIQHQCYNDNDAKDEVRTLNGIKALVSLFNSDNEEVRRYVTGATRNLIYENMQNKIALINEGGIPSLVKALSEPDDELRKNITGILWNMSSKENLKEKLASETLSELTDKILIPLATKEKNESEFDNYEDSTSIKESHSETEIFCNTTGCLRNLSSVSQKTRDQMRDTRGLVDSLVEYICACLKSKSKSESKGVENSMCILRNLSYQLYSEIPPNHARTLDGPTRDQDKELGEAIGCFTPNSRKAKNKKNVNLSTLSEVSKTPKGMAWLWHPQIVSVYNQLLQKCETNAVTREAAAGSLQNITAGDRRWASVLSWVALDRERMLPCLLNYLRTDHDMELRSLTGLLRNLSRHAANKDEMATKSVGTLVEKLPDNGVEKERTVDTVVNICGFLNNLVTCSALAARDILFFDGVPKLLEIKKSTGSPGKMKAAKAASTVLSNMYNYKKFHKQYLAKGFRKDDFIDNVV
ncbi:plakophilin-3a isoform X2 [Mugil cephalus]|uniref:plakophilin-3a isoform X2 n=1 Tax=Mugil cephalus TaxID=48193 RepID=UPI001FB79CFE|nr:plakophilin-3a isoform X2 [Mugil cephalus]